MTRQDFHGRENAGDKDGVRENTMRYIESIPSEQHID